MDGPVASPTVGGMYKTIVAGTDGSRGRSAASLAQVLATATGARLVLVGVECELPLPLLDTFAHDPEAFKLELHAVRDELAPGATVRVAVDVSPSHALRRIAADEDADLVVVGSHRHGRHAEVARGDDAMQVLHGAPCAVVVAPDELPACRELRQIGVGIDDSPESGVALRLALELARPTGARLKLLAVVGDAYATPAGIVPAAHCAELHSPAVASHLDKARTVIDEALGRCDDVTASGDVVVGDPVTALTALGESCDLLVLGSRRWGPVRRLALGSTSEWVIRHATCPVLVPPRHAVSEHDEGPRAALAGVVL